MLFATVQPAPTSCGFARPLALFRLRC